MTNITVYYNLYSIPLLAARKTAYHNIANENISLYCRISICDISLSIYKNAMNVIKYSSFEAQ